MARDWKPLPGQSLYARVVVNKPVSHVAKPVSHVANTYRYRDAEKRRAYTAKCRAVGFQLNGPSH